MPASGVWNFLIWLHYLALSLWIGGIGFLAGIAAPLVHRSMASRSVAGEIVRAMLKRLNTVELTCCMLLLVTSFSAFRFVAGHRLLGGLITLILIMGILTSFYAFHVAPQMQAIKDRNLTFEALPAGNPDKAEFDRLHKFYVRLMSLNLMLGLVVLYGSVILLK